MNIELEAALQTIGLGQDDRLPAPLDVGAEVKSGSDGQLGDHHIAAQQGGICSAGQPDVGVGGGTYSRRITQANIVRGGAEIEEEDAVLVSGGTGQRHGAAAGGAAESLDLDAVAIEQQNAVEVAEAAGKVVVTDESILHVQTPLQDGLRERAAGVEVHAQVAARQDFGVERLEERHIDRAVQDGGRALARRSNARGRGR